MKPKYPQGFRTKRDLIAAIKSAPANELFFCRDTMRFFGRQTFDIHLIREHVVLVITYTKKFQRTSYRKVDPETLKLTRFNHKNEAHHAPS